MKKIFFILLLFYSSKIFSQNNDWIYLSKGFFVTSFAEEGNYIWICNYSGIVKMDKTTGTKTYYNKTTSPIPDNWVNTVKIDNNGIKWFGTQNHGIVKYDGTNWTVFDTSNSPLPYQTATKMALDGDNNLWVIVSSNNAGLMKYDGTNWTTYNISNSGLPNNYINCIYSDGNNIWVGTPGALSKFDGITWTTYNTSNSNISPNQALAIDKDGNGNIWLAYYNGVAKFDGNSFYTFNETNTNIPNLQISSLAIDSNNTVWVGCTTYGGQNCNPCIGGIMSFDGSAWLKYDTANSSMSDIEVKTVFVDNSNNIWIGCFKSGMVDRKNNSLWSNYDLSTASLDDKNVREIVFDENSFAFIGTGDPVFASNYGEGVVKYNWSTWAHLNYYNDNSYAIASDKTGNLYVKNKTEIKKFDGTNWTSIPNAPLPSIPYSLELNEINIDTLGGIWMDYFSYVTTDSLNNPTFHEGVAYYNGASWTTYNASNSLVPDFPINVIKVDHSNNIWVGTSGGLAKYDGINWTVFTTSNSLIPSNYITSLAIDTANNVWISNGNYGFAKFDGTSWTNYPNPTLNQFQCYGTYLEADIDGSVWQIAGVLYLIGFDGTNWTTFKGNNSPIPEGFNITSLNIDKFGNKWIGTGIGVMVYKQGGVIATSVPLLHQQDISLLIYPNPFSESFEIKFPYQFDNVELTIYDLLSRPHLIKNYERCETIKVSRNGLSSGMYFYQLKSGNKIIFSGKIIAK